jgi:hypothetical protein
MPILSFEQGTNEITLSTDNQVLCPIKAQPLIASCSQLFLLHCLNILTYTIGFSCFIGGSQSFYCRSAVAYRKENESETSLSSTAGYNRFSKVRY